MPPDAFVARVSRWRTGLLVAGGLGFVALGALLLRIRDDVAVHAVAWVAIVFFTACALAGARQMFRTGAVMRIDARGVMWRRWSDETIPWDAFARAGAMQLQRQMFVSLWLRDPVRWRSAHVLGRLAGANKALGFGDIALSVSGTDRSFDDLVAAVDRFAPGLRDRR